MNGGSPNFIVIGPGRSGTTWIYSMLKKHPEICMSSSKETVFFDEYYDRGFEWYKKFFRPSPESKAIGEVSNTYIFSPLAARRIWEFNPDIQLISPLRNPIERIFSLYLFAVRTAQTERSFEDFIEKWPNGRTDILERHKYMTKINAYFKYFSRKQILILLYDDLKDNPSGFLKQLFRFLKVKEDYFPEDANRRVEEASQYRYKYVAKFAKRLGVFVRDLGYPEIVTRVKESFVPRFLYKRLPNGNYPTMNPETREMLKDYFWSDVEQTSQMVERDLVSLWLEANVGHNVARKDRRVFDNPTSAS